MSELNEKQIAALKLLDEGKEYQNYFFRTKEGLIWFYPLKERGYFAAEHNPEPQGNGKGGYFIPYWHVLDYLEKISKKCDKPENRQYAEELMQIIRDVTRPSDASRADNSTTWWYFAKIMANLPTDVIRQEDIDLVTDWLESRFSTSLIDSEIGKSLLPRLLESDRAEDWKKAVRLVEIVTRIRWEERKYGSEIEKKPATFVDLLWLNDLFKTNTISLCERCGHEVLNTLKERLKELLTPKKDDQYSHIWRASIEEEKHHDIKNTFVSATRDVLLAYAERKSQGAEKTLHSFLEDSFLTLRRIGLYVINEFYDDYSEVFWKAVSLDLFKPALKPELSALLKKHFHDFSRKQQDRIVDIIENLTRDWSDKTEKDRLDSRLRIGWLRAIKDLGNSRADLLYKEYAEITKLSEEGESDDQVRSRSPYSVVELLSLDVPKIVELLKVSKEDEDQADALRDAIKHDPDKFQDNLTFFLKTRLIYQNAILRAFEQLWNDKKYIKWEKVLDFCKAIVNSGTFWQQTEDSGTSKFQVTPGWVVSGISDLITAGVQSDEWAFPENLNPLAESIIRLILEKQPSTASADIGATFRIIIKTPKKDCLEALINFSLRKARLADKAKEDHQEVWKHLQPLYDRELEKCQNANFEFSHIAGRYLRQLNYLSSNWVKANIDRIFSKAYPDNWRCAILGYLHVRSVHKEIYVLLKEHGHIEQALETEFKSPESRRTLIRHISIAYLHGLESLSETDSLFRKVLDREDAKDMGTIVFLFWENFHHIGQEQKAIDSVLALWEWCSDRFRGREEANAKIVSDLNLLTAFLDEITDEQKQWLMQSAPYVEVQHHISRFIRELHRLVDKSPAAVADVYLSMLSKTIPTVDEKRTRTIVEKLYKAGLRDKANELANAYARAGRLELLRDLYEQYNP